MLGATQTKMVFKVPLACYTNKHELNSHSYSTVPIEQNPLVTLAEFQAVSEE